MVQEILTVVGLCAWRNLWMVRLQYLKLKPYKKNRVKGTKDTWNMIQKVNKKYCVGIYWNGVGVYGWKFLQWQNDRVHGRREQRAALCLLCLQLTRPHPFVHGVMTACVLCLNFRLATVSFKIWCSMYSSISFVTCSAYIMLATWSRNAVSLILFVLWVLVHFLKFTNCPLLALKLPVPSAWDCA